MNDKARTMYRERGEHSPPPMEPAGERLAAEPIKIAPSSCPGVPQAVGTKLACAAVCIAISGWIRFGGTAVLLLWPLQGGEQRALRW